ncbi:hypothetical protein [Clostridium sporogenes]|uniref:hypothetical protein n=1 Tax=Clostridium sporogenes TaxID=1509 RepID=UPI00066937DB|nr:hypothetical protein [Clostridium sporogenes]
MDINNILSLAASAATIITFIIQVFKILSNNKDDNSTVSINNIGDSNNINLNSNNTNNFNTDSHDTNIEIYHVNNQSYYPNNNVNIKSNSNDVIGFLALFIIIIAIISKFYLDNRSSIILGIIILGILSFIVTLSCTLILAENRLITNSTLLIKTIKWAPLFLVIKFINRPLYNSNTLNMVAELIKKGTGYLRIFFSYPYDVMFFVIQFLGLAILTIVFISYLISSIKDTYKSLKTKLPIKTILWKDAIPYFALQFFIFFLVSGLYTKLFSKLSLISQL